MTRKFSDGHPKVLPACNFHSQYYFYNIFLQKSCRFSLQTLTKFEATKTGSGVGFLRLTAVCSAANYLTHGHLRRLLYIPSFMYVTSMPHILIWLPIPDPPAGDVITIFGVISHVMSGHITAIFDYL